MELRQRALDLLQQADPAAKAAAVRALPPGRAGFRSRIPAPSFQTSDAGDCATASAATPRPRRRVPGAPDPI